MTQDNEQTVDPSRQNPRSGSPLESWKEIAAYLNRDERTARRWEKEEGLPVRRHQHGSRASVYTYASELDAWRAARKPKAAESESPLRGRRFVPALGGGLALLALAAAILRGPILNPPDPLAEAAGSGVIVRQVWTGPDVDTLGTVSLDGRFLSYVHWATGDLGMRDLEREENRLLTSKGSWDVSENYAESSAISPDGKQVVYAWGNWDPDVGFYELRLVGTDGSEPRLLYRNPEVPYLKPKGWSADGKLILATFFTKDRTTQLALISAEDQSVHVVRTLNWDDNVEASLSPDGRYIAYDFPRDGPQTARDIFLLAADGSREISLVRHSANDFSPIWTPDGERVMFASNRTETLSLWAVPVADGRPLGEALLLKRDVGLKRPLGLTDTGALFYGLGSGREDVYVASLGLDSEAVPATAVRATERFLGSNRSAEWSPDGRHLAYFSRRNAKASKVLCIQSLEFGDYREPPLKLSISDGDVLTQPRWTPDGSALAIRASDRRGRQGIFRVDVETGKESALVLSGPGEHLSKHSWSPDGEAILFRRTRQGSKFEQIITRNVESGKEKELHRTPDRYSISGLAVSPDGRELAFIQNAIGEQALNVMSLAEGSSREITRPENRIFQRWVYG